MMCRTLGIMLAVEHSCYVVSFLLLLAAVALVTVFSGLMIRHSFWTPSNLSYNIVSF